MADSSYVQFDTESQQPKKILLVDNGNGTYSLATVLKGSSVRTHNFMPATPLAANWEGEFTSDRFYVGDSREITLAFVLQYPLSGFGFQLYADVMWYESVDDDQPVAHERVDSGDSAKPEGSNYPLTVKGQYAKVYLANAHPTQARTLLGFACLRP